MSKHLVSILNLFAGQINNNTAIIMIRTEITKQSQVIIANIDKETHKEIHVQMVTKQTHLSQKSLEISAQTLPYC